MTSFDDHLDAAETAPRTFRDVRVCLDAGVAQRRTALLDQLDEAREADKNDQRLAASNDERTKPILDELEALEQEARDALHTLRFYRLNGDEWAVLTSKHPVRLESPIDKKYGYNFDAVCTFAAIKSGVLLEGEDEAPLPREKWFRLLKVLSGHEVQAIRDAVWALNEWDPEQRLEALVKDSGAASRSDSK